MKIGCKDKGKKQAGTIFGQEFYRIVRIALTLAVDFAPTDPRLGAGGTQPHPHLREAQPARRRHHFCHRTAGVVTGCRTRGQKSNRVKESKGQKSQRGKRVKERGKNYLPLKISSSFASNSCSRSPVAIIFPSGSISTISGMAFTPYISDAMDSHPFTSDS